ncbi:cytochrome c biogenesis protein CcdA [Helicobacter ailurogastricus]|uniref:Cytochrome c-type biogenesis protein CcdA (DsbD analog) n=1 Tax=Helicobacter ailurogastricus TaxID=1578720 RepID=A0A0K2XDJ4_9HELI|nr:cytochrome c biogenesis protein CcdA [Helicobacter ailurogastricus]CRF41392.1 Cytochrome c-type biogenesis protein CcdA (DsbD analog) [Helicobacter ailurogastricus]CRF41991.1 Cytochrome c-type biogenesis protein CcdA (DsbD analog) [Helicobacter ailurogastricus]CRF43643.1 Cytochrome c-type biogenesis protein CcdA (DsbD analog) [Helicobacter ailurogastricus]GLH57701.1 Cytochrome c biogenesis protein CcdA [Helicobacter ailurogastricus]GLH58890.1 Cytochrome c biogenesis protein CcdA [Helicobact
MLDDSLLALFNQTPLIASFLAGILAFLSPCVLPLIPAYMSYISQTSLEELKAGNAPRLAVLFKASLFVLGFGLVFWLVGVSMAKIMHAYLNAPWVRIVAGSLVVLFGLHFLGVLPIKWLYKSKTLQVRLEFKNPFLNSFIPFILGASFALGWTPCIGPIFTSIVLLSGAEHAYGMALLGVFVLGFGLPFLVVALLINQAFGVLKKMRHYSRAVEIVSGLVLIGMGVLILSGQMEHLGALLQN